MALSTQAADARALAPASEHRMHYDVDPELAFGSDGAKRQVGTRFRVFGCHPHGTRPQPGCAMCSHLHADLATVVASVVPPDPRMRWEILPFTPALSWDPGEDEDEVSVAIVATILDGERSIAPDEEAEVRAFQKRLEATGVRRGSWRAGPAVKNP